MSKQRSTQMAQLRLWEEPQSLIHCDAPLLPEMESKEAYEHRRVAEMAEKLQWRGMSRAEPVRCWPGVEIAEGEASWRAFLMTATSGTIGLVLLALHSLLDPLTPDSIDESTGLRRRPVEVISQVEERSRARMVQLAELLDWPRVSYWAANRTQVIGPEEARWRKCFVYGCSGLIADAVGALERRWRGEPEKVKQASYQQSSDDEEE